MDEFGGRWIETYSGGKLHFLNPQPEEIQITDIAHALSLTCRFGGQCKSFYSVAEHSIRVAEIVPPKYKLQALLHDASEAYLPDLPRPIKAKLPEFKSMELIILYNIWLRFGISKILRGEKVIKGADNILLATEARDLMSNMDNWAPLPEPLREKILPWKSQQYVEAVFLRKFELYRELLGIV